MTILFLSAALSLSFVVCQAAVRSTAIPLPIASSITVQELTDTSRLNPFNGSSEYRQVVVSYYEPYLKDNCASIGE